MKLLNRLTIQNLKLNKKRTIVTIIGIILATTLITGVATLVACFQASTREYVRETSGNYHYEFLNVPGKDIEEIENMENIENVYLTENLGYSEKKTTDDEINEDETNLEDLQFQVLGFSKGAMENLGITLDEGRFPENENEIVISNYVETRTDKEIELEKEITLTIKDEETEQEKTKTYKIVGTVNITGDNLEQMYLYTPEEIPFYYTAITYLEDYTAESKLNVYVKFKDLNSRYETISQILDIIDEETFNTLKTTDIDKTIDNLLEYGFLHINKSFILVETGDFSDEDTIEMIYSLAVIIIAIIIITSVYCIKNSFNISITEKVKQYGILSSIGATSKQIRKNVLYEAFILALIAIPIGIILGVGSIYVVLKIIENVLGEKIFGMKFIFATNLSAIILTIILSSLTIYLSARKSAKMASKISPMEAIRSNQDIKIKSKKIRAPKIIKKLFGIGGDIAYKNLKRNSRKYRTTVVSITVSVTIFIAMMSFTSYAFKLSDLYFSDYNYNIYVTSQDYEELKEISEDSNVYNAALARDSFVFYEDNGEHHSIEADEENYFNSYNSQNLSFELIAFGEQEYNRLIKELGLKYEDVKDKAILYDYKNKITDAEGNTTHKILRITNYQEGDIIPIEIWSSYEEYDEELGQYVLKNETKAIDLEIAKVSEKMPPVGPYNTGNVFLIVSDEFFDENQLEYSIMGLFMNVDNDVEVEKYLNETYPTVFHIGNINEEEREVKAIITTVAVCLYTFIAIITLIGITNIFNTITTSMELRQKEFAILKSIGMTKKEFNRMIRLESIFYGTKSLIIGIPLGIIISYIIYKAFLKGISVDYVLPINGIIIAIVAVFVLIGAIMKYSLNKINKQNIIETIRNDNI